MKGEKGFALVMTLLVTALLVALSVQFVDEVFVDTSLSRHFVDGQQASLLASSGIDGGIALLKFTESLPDHSYSSPADPWRKPLYVEDERGGVTVTIEEESGKLNLNKIAPPSGQLDPANFHYGTAVRLAQRLKLPPDLWEVLADWVDLNQEPHPSGAETAYYSTLKPSYSAKNRPLETFEELGLLKGFNQEVREKLLPFVTVYPDYPQAPSPPVNINTASKDLLMALHQDMTEAMAERIIEARPFKDRSHLTRVPGIDNQMATALLSAISVKGYVYRLLSHARVGETERRIEAVVRMEGVAPRMLYWREY